MKESVIAAAICLIVVGLMMRDHMDNVRDSRAIAHRLMQESMVRRNNAADEAFQMQLHRERLLREYNHWDANWMYEEWCKP